MERTNLYLKDVNDRPVTYKSVFDEEILDALGEMEIKLNIKQIDIKYKIEKKKD